MIGEGVTRGRGERGGSGRGAGEGGRDGGRGSVMPVGVCSISVIPSSESWGRLEMKLTQGLT